MSYVTKFDNTFWTPYGGVTTWTGTEYDANGLNPTDFSGLTAGGWATGYRPTKIRLTLSTSISVNVDVIINPGGSQEIIANIALTSTPTQFEIALDFANGDIVDLELDSNPPASGTWNLVWHNIEFFESSITAFWQDKVKCTEVDA